jgi:hypothetical protein
MLTYADYHLLLDRVVSDETKDAYRLRLAYAVRPIHSLHATHIYWYEDTHSSNPSERGHIYSSKRTRILLYVSRTKRPGCRLGGSNQSQTAFP